MVIVDVRNVEESRRALVPLLSVLIAVMFFLLGSLSDFWLRDHASELVRHNQRHRNAGRRTQLNSALPGTRVSLEVQDLPPGLGCC